MDANLLGRVHHCQCGRDHAVLTKRVEIGRHILPELPQWMLQDDGEGRVTVVYDINSLTTYTKDITEPYHLNRTMPVASVAGKDDHDACGRQSKAAEHHNETGSMNLKATLVDYLLTMQDNRGIQNFDGKTDVQVYQGAKIDSVRVDATLWPVGSTNFIYVTWYING